MGLPDYYAVLGVAPDAEPDEVRAAAKRTAARTHPDRGGSAEEFRRAREAWDVLKDPVKRAQYDRDRERERATVAWPTEGSIGERVSSYFDFRWSEPNREKP